MRFRLVTAALPLTLLVLAACEKEVPVTARVETNTVAGAPSATPAATAPGATVTATATATVSVAAPAATAPDADPTAEGPGAPMARLEGTSPGDLIPKFAVAGLAAGAKAPAFDSQAPGQVTVYCVGSTTCPYTNKYAEKLQQIEKGYAGKDVRFVWLYSNGTESDADKTKWHADKGLAGVFVIDRDAVAAKALGADRTPELVVTSADGTIVYRGAIDDGSGDPKRAKVEYLRDAIDATLAGKPVEVNATQPAG